MPFESPYIENEKAEANELFVFAMRYNVNGIPQTYIYAGKGVVLCAIPEEYILQEINRTTRS